MKKYFSYSFMIVGTLFLSLAISLLRYSAQGTDPYTTLNLGISTRTEISFGGIQLLVNLILFSLMFTYKKNEIGVGTIVNMVLIGFISDIFYFKMYDYFPLISNIFTRISITLLAIFIASIGIALYMESSLGIAPYDALTNILIDYNKNVKLPFFLARMIIDLIAITVGFLLGSVVGVATLLLALFTGPMVHLVRYKVINPFLKKKGIVY